MKKIEGGGWLWSIEDWLKHGIYHEVDDDVRTKDGRQSWVKIRYSRIFDSNGIKLEIFHNICNSMDAFWIDFPCNLNCSFLLSL